MDQYATEIIYVISEDPLTRKELAKTLSTRLVSKRTAFRSRLCCAEKARLGVEHHYWMEDMGDAFDVFDVISKVDGDTIRPLYSDSASVTPVEALLENSVQQPFEKSLPPWRVFMVNERVEVAQRVLTRTSLIFNLHHVLGDGFTLMNALLDMTMPSVNDCDGYYLGSACFLLPC
ncbi:hypothetical protein Pmar_PMAR002171 [Perkinsus marinus ATCC 50983]|uniref:Diacylglycerol O-acyltransferase n=1 Tax=Perkinsus marinus (strain ATCC 50983 / TXsc) TaxID=423536 RepID=C5L8U4_PERM5|nr:hypothetical protein Pmar_PMAR002171 [Perkinsus marinus ATCC 50983]EER06802.1 hypothetical protein Pmar_PMAR002171 [Perkinsus marinus ATCC 50983]|eukprot:XP_002774986.1 hypothetical protein Pmar_PMAR002171 [Perkinsus marinus ATCC 50983]